MFKGYTPRANRILSVLSQEEAKRRHADQLLPEHVLIAVVKEGSGLACKLLRSLGIDPVAVEIELEKSLPPRKGAFLMGDVPPSRRIRLLLESASEEARLLQAEFVGTEHLLIAAAREEGSLLQAFLKQSHADAERIKAALNSDQSKPDSQRPDQSRRKSASGQATSRTQFLDEYSRDLTALTKEDKIDPVIGRDKE